MDPLPPPVLTLSLFPNHLGESPIKVAMSKGFADIAALLRGAGAESAAAANESEASEDVCVCL